MVEISIIATLTGATIGAILGSFTTYWLNRRSRQKEEQKQIEMLRRSLVAELASMDVLTTTKASNYATQMPANNSIPMEVFRSNSDRISLLTPGESQAVIRFYSSAMSLEQDMDSAKNLLQDSSNPQLHDLTPINESFDVIRDRWKECVLQLIAHLDQFPSEVTHNGKTIEVDNSLSSKEIWYVLNHKTSKESLDDFE